MGRTRYPEPSTPLDEAYARVSLEPPDIVHLALPPCHVDLTFTRDQLTSIATGSLGWARDETGDEDLFGDAPDDLWCIRLDGRFHGPLSNAEGARIEAALSRARGDWLSVDGTTFWLSDSGSRSNVGSTLQWFAVDVVTELDPRAQIIEERKAPTSGSIAWVLLHDLRGPDASLAFGPLAERDAELLAHTIRTWTSLGPRSDEIVEVTEEELARDPVRFHGRLVRVTGTWRSGFECSKLADVWVEGTKGAMLPRNREYQAVERFVRLTGRLLYPSGNAGGYGHRNASPGLLLVEKIEYLGTPADRRP